MIRHIVPTKFPDLAVAYGLKYEFPRVLEVGIRMLRRMVAMVKEEDRKAQCRIRSNDGHRRRAFDERGIALTREEIEGVQQRFDVSDDFWQLVAGQFVASFHPFGNVALAKTSKGYRAADGRPTSSLDPMPYLMITRDLGDGRVSTAFQTQEQQLIHRAMRTFLERDGIRLEGTPLMFTASYPHETFGASTDVVRIKVVE